MGRRRKKKNPRIKKACVDTMNQLEALRDLAADHELTVEVSQITGNRGTSISYHFMFNDRHGKRVLDFWPGTGRTWSPITLEKSRVEDCWIALDEAARIASLYFSEEMRAENHLGAIATGER